MSPREPTLSIRLFWPFLRVIGADERMLDVLAEMGQSLHDLTDRERRVPCAAALRGLERAVEALADPTLGLRAGACADQDVLDVVEHAARSSDTLGDALQVLVRFSRALDEGATTWLEERGDEVSFCHAPLVAHSAAANDFAVSSALAFARRNCEAYAPPLELWVMHARPSYSAAYARHVDGPVRFGATHNAIVMHRASLRTRMRGRNPLLAAAFERRAHELLQLQHATTGVTQQVRAELSARLAHDPVDMLDVAHALGMSPTTLWRKLKDEGTTFSVLLDDVRRELSLRYLRASEPSLPEIALLLGFADVRAFAKAFKRWLGVSPATFRNNFRSPEGTPGHAAAGRGRLLNRRSRLRSSTAPSC